MPSFYPPLRASSTRGSRLEGGRATLRGHPVSAPEYVLDVPFVRQFCPELSPTLLRAAASLKGFPAPSIDEPFDYCEVGSGTGDTVCTLAAAYPGSRFWGIDLSAEHVALARGIAERGRLRNLTLLEGDFEALAAELPPLDFLCAHGLMSWIAPAKRKALVALAAARLKPGGLLYVSYNAFPGWAALAPLRRLLRDAGGTEGTTLDRARRGLDAAKEMREHGARYFVDNPAAGEMLDTMERAGLRYVVHEYFHEHWAPLHVADVAAEMAAVGLRFAGELPLYRGIPRLAMPGSMTDLVTRGADRIAIETRKDLATNVFFRGDVYVAGGPEPDPSRAASYLDDTPFTTLVTAERVRRDVKLPHAALQMLGEPFDTLVGLSARGPVTLRDVMAALPGFDAARVREAAIDLLATMQLVPARRGAVLDAHVFNTAVLRQPLTEGQPVFLASPIAGTGVSLPGLQTVCLRLLTLVDPSGRDAALRAFIARQPLKLHVADRAVTSVDEQTQVLAAELEKFRLLRLPKLVALGVVRGDLR